MVINIRVIKSAETLERVLCIMTLACRPLVSSELGILAKLDYPKEVLGLIQSCASFLTVQGQTVNFVHKSAKDYFVDRETVRLFFCSAKPPE